MKIIGTGSYLPDNLIDSSVFDKRFNLEAGWTKEKSGVKTRHYITPETQSSMAKEAVLEAIKSANIKLTDIDCIVSACGVMQQLIPCTASLIQRELGLENSGIPCFDINSTCLSFVTALDVVSSLIDTNKYKTVLIVSSDAASTGLDLDDVKSSILFGDGAAAIIVQKNDANETSCVLKYNQETYSIGADEACIKGGSSYLHSTKYSKENEKEYLFHMNGTKLYEIASKKLKPLFDKTLFEAGLTIDDIKLVIPHQASLMSMKLIQRKLQIPNGKYLYNIENTGNMIATSIPYCIDYVIKNQMISKGDKIVLLVTSAGLSLGVLIFEY